MSTKIFKLTNESRLNPLHSLGGEWRGYKSKWKRRNGPTCEEKPHYQAFSIEVLLFHNNFNLCDIIPFDSKW